MYRVLKEKGNNKNITLENMDTKANIIIGRVSSSILDLLNEAGHRIGEDMGLTIKDEWSLEVNDEIGKELARKALSMSKPVRDQSKKTKDLFKKPNNKIDAMDVLLGLASYSN